MPLTKHRNCFGVVSVFQMSRIRRWSCSWSLQPPCLKISAGSASSPGDLPFCRLEMASLTSFRLGGTLSSFRTGDCSMVSRRMVSTSEGRLRSSEKCSFQRCILASCSVSRVVPSLELRGANPHEDGPYSSLVRS